MVYIGIDLGTTYSCIAVIENDHPVIIYSDDGNLIYTAVISSLLILGQRTIPSFVAYCDDEAVVGYPAYDCNTELANILYGAQNNF